MAAIINPNNSDSSRSIYVVNVVAACSIVFGRDTLRGILKYANLQQDWLIHVDPWDTTGRHEVYPETDGAIYAGGGDDVYHMLLNRSKHVVCCEASYDQSKSPIVSSDEEAIGKIAADHLLDCGYQHFAYYGVAHGASRNVGNMRYSGFDTELKCRDHSCKFVCPVSWPSGSERMSRSHRRTLIEWLDPLPKPIGIMTSDDTLAFDLAAAIRETKFKVPDDIAIIGVNNDELLCEAASPPLSSVDVDFQRLGYEAAKLLDRMLRGDNISKSQRHIQMSPLGIHQRVSTNQLAIDDKDLAAAIQFIRNHACDPCGVRDVLNHVPVARRWLEREFVEKVGRTPYEEILRVRIDQSKRMLLQLDLSVDEIARRCGYSATSNFNRIFRKVTGQTPAAFRRSCRSD